MTDHATVGPIDADDSPVSPRRLWREGLFIAALALLLNLVGNGRVGLWDRDEPRYAEAVREMRVRRDWISPSFNGEPRYHKPIFIYWAMGLGTAIGGDNPFGARLGSALAGTCTALLCWRFGRRIVGPLPALIGTVALITSPIMVTESKLATADAVLTCFLVLAQFCVWELNRKPSLRWALTFWTAMALAFLTKGPVGPALIGVSALASWWFGGPSAWRSRLRLRPGLALFALLTIPWYLAIGISSNGDFYRFALGKQLIRRIGTGMEEHGGFPGYYLVFTLATFYPWSTLVPAAVVGAWSRRKASPAFGFLLGWAIGPLILLELVRTKLIHYYLPAMPALALLVGWFVTAVSRDFASIRRWPGGRLALGLLGGIGIATTAGLFAGAAILPATLRWPCLFLGTVLLAGTLVAIARFTQGLPLQAVGSLAACWALFMTAFAGWLLPKAEPFRLSRIVGEKLAGYAESERAKPILVTFQEPGIIYAMKRTAPTMRNWDEIERRLLVDQAYVTALTPEQAISLERDGRFDLKILEALEGFNISKGEGQPLKLTRIALRDAAPARRVVAGEQSVVK